jgi:hypothetical protein
MPNQLPPLTAGQKFKLQTRSQFDYVEIPWYGILAGFSQTRKSSPGSDKVPPGYGKRYASEWGDGSIENFMTAAVFTSSAPRSALLPIGQRLILASLRLRSQPHCGDPLGFGATGIQCFSGVRKCCGRCHFDIRLSSSRRTHLAQCGKRMGHAAWPRHIYPQPEGVLARHSPQILP